MSAGESIEIVDSHTEGEPTRVVIAGWPEPAGRTVAERRDTMRREQDHLRRGVVLEPRGHEAIVGALLVPADRPEALTGVVFFNDVSYLGMCGHGLIGVVRTLEYLGRLKPGHVEIDTPVGPVSAELSPDGLVTIRNIPSYLYRADVTADVPGIGKVTGDIAWSGNWFFLTKVPEPALTLYNQTRLLEITIRIREALRAAGVTGKDGELVDHIELYGPPVDHANNARNFVLCPGTTYDRSPCGTGTSAKLVTLHAKGQLAIGAKWRQESIVGSVFTGWLEAEGNNLIPRIQGHAYITSRASLQFDPKDPFRNGLV